MGFFQVTGFGAADGQADGALEMAARFLALPLSDRLALDNRTSPHFRGYTRRGHEITAGRPDAREQLGVSADREPVTGYPASEPYSLFQGPNLWPDPSLPELKCTILAWTDLMSTAGRELLGAISVALDLPEDYFDEQFRDTPAWMAKLIHYVGGVVEEAGYQGVGSHADYGVITLLLQDQVGGLERNPPGSDDWVPVEPLPGALVVNLGEILEVAAWGYLAATVHRVCTPPPGVDRYAVPFFWSPRLGTVLAPVQLSPAIETEASGISDDPDNPMLSSYGANVPKGWRRAHPEVAKLHHPELLN